MKQKHADPEQKSPVVIDNWSVKNGQKKASECRWLGDFFIFTM